NYIKQKTDFLIENIVSLSDLIRSVFLTQKIELKGLGSKIFDKFIYKPCRFIVDNKKNVIIITCAIGSLIISGALINKFLKKEEVDSNSNNNLGVDSKQDQIGHDIEHDSDEQKGESDEQKKGIKLKLTTQKEFKLRSKFWTQEEQVKILAKYDTSEHDKIRKIFLEKEQEEKSISDRLNKNNNNNTTNKENMAEAKMGRWARFKTGVKNGVKKCFSGFAVNSQQKAETKFPGSCGIDMNLKK
ncbi:hypothetical protein K9M16_04820, partial [Candidatus Babeliales bacterium]|nr:hypothetical protein [Candidatus Babeliales bacterium]